MVTLTPTMVRRCRQALNEHPTRVGYDRAQRTREALQVCYNEFGTTHIPEDADGLLTALTRACEDRRDSALSDNARVTAQMYDRILDELRGDGL